MQPQHATQCRDSLANAVSRRSTANYAPIIAGFAAMGIPALSIIPRENVFTFNAWLALGRRVREGESGVPIVTFVKCKGSAVGASVTRSARVRPVSTQVFHISQTEPVAAGNAAH
jgi:hypothetical protein